MGSWLRDVSQTPGTLELAEKKKWRFFLTKINAESFHTREQLNYAVSQPPRSRSLAQKFYTEMIQAWGLFLESPDNFSGPESRFVFVVARIF